MDWVVRIYNQLAKRFLRPRGVDVEDIDRSVAGMNRVEWLIGNKCFTQTPALRRVVSFSIFVTFDYLQEKTGVTLKEMPPFEQQWRVGTEKRLKIFAPAKSIVVEEWATHTVVTDFSGRRVVIYPDYNFGGNLWPLRTQSTSHLVTLSAWNTTRWRHGRQPGDCSLPRVHRRLGD